eukprot:6296696-Prymnesium_polylepis.1
MFYRLAKGHLARKGGELEADYVQLVLAGADSAGWTRRSTGSPGRTETGTFKWVNLEFESAEDDQDDAGLRVDAPEAKPLPHAHHRIIYAPPEPTPSVLAALPPLAAAQRAAANHERRMRLAARRTHAGADGTCHAVCADAAADAAASATLYVNTSDARVYLSSGNRTAFNSAAVNANLARARRALQDLELARSSAGSTLVKAVPEQAVQMKWLESQLHKSANQTADDGSRAVRLEWEIEHTWRRHTLVAPQAVWCPF